MKKLLMLLVALVSVSAFSSCNGVDICKINPQLCVPPSPPAPTPVPEPSAPPVTSPPVTVPPVSICTPPLGDKVILINDEKDPISMGLANQFLRQVYADHQGQPGLGEKVAREVEQMTGCARYSDCMTEEPQRFFARLLPRLWAKGMCAGQFEPGVQDGVTVAELPSNTPPWAEALWTPIHVINYGGPKVAWGKILMRPGDIPQGNEASEWAVYQETEGGGTIPTPGPGPTPTPAPPTNNSAQVWTATINVDKTSVSGPATVEIVCTPRNKDGQQLQTPASLIFVGAQLGGPIKGTHFSVDKRALSASLHVKAGCPAGVIKANCAWYKEENFDKGVTTPNVSIQVH